MFEFITSFIQQSGYWGIALLMLAENVFPPIPSELIMPLAGYSAAQGKLNIFLAILAGSAGSVLGVTLWYGLGRWIGSERLKTFAQDHGRWLTLRPDEIDRACAWFDRYGNVAVLLGRLVPAVRTLISIPAGIAKMPFTRFLIYTSIGTVAWTALLASLGYVLQESYDQVANWVNPISNVVVGILVVVYLYRVATFRRHVPKREGQGRR